MHHNSDSHDTARLQGPWLIAARIVNDFNATLHQQVHLNHLSQQLLAVVQETMQPAHLTLWLLATRQSPISSTSSLPSSANQLEPPAPAYPSTNPNPAAP